MRYSHSQLDKLESYAQTGKRPTEGDHIVCVSRKVGCFGDRYDMYVRRVVNDSYIRCYCPDLEANCTLLVGEARLLTPAQGDLF